MPAFAATARASERRACRDAVAAFYDDATDAPAKQSEADDDVLVDDAADDRRGAFHAAHCVPGLCGNQPVCLCYRRFGTNAPYILFPHRSWRAGYARRTLSRLH